MNRTELARKIAADTRLSIKDCDRMLTAMIGIIINTLVEGDKVLLNGLMTLNTHQRRARIGRNPKTKEPINIPPKRVPYFRPGKLLKDSVEGSD